MLIQSAAKVVVKGKFIVQMSYLKDTNLIHSLTCSQSSIEKTKKHNNSQISRKMEIIKRWDLVK